MQFTEKGKKFTVEGWSTGDNGAWRGCLVQGAPNAPAVILLHRYGADRSWLLNLGMKMNSAAGFTVLIPDLRGHGEKPAVKNTSFGGCEGDDLAGAIDFLRTLKAENGEKLVGQKIGLYGVEIGAIAAVYGAANSNDVNALALDSVPSSPADVLQKVVGSRTSFASAAVKPLANTAAPLYFASGCYKNTPLCETAATLNNRKILLLAGKDAPLWQESTDALAGCFGGGANVQKKTDLNPSGYSLIQSTTPQQQEAYNNLVIEFFRQSLSN